MKSMQYVRKHLEDFAMLFRGHPKAHGLYIPSKSKSVTGEKVKGKSYTKRKALTEDDYTKHLHGEVGIGIAPLLPDGKVYSVAIDVDVYPLDPKKYIDIINKADLPIIPFRSKSGGLHLYIFFSKAELAKTVLPYVHIVRHILNLPKDTEVFPKQTKLIGDSVGNWINIPYFNCHDTERYAYNNDYSPMSIEEFITAANKAKITFDELKAIVNDIPLSDAPPCLQSIFLSGGLGTERNVFLFNCAVYCKAKHEEDFAENLHKLNKRLVEPLEYMELDTTIIASHNKKTYSYQCANSILTSHCDKDLCKLRKHGKESDKISKFDYGELTQYKTGDEKPYYKWVINGKDMMFYSESEMMDQNKFKYLCLRHLHQIPNEITRKVWHNTINLHLGNMTVEVLKDDDMTERNLWLSVASEFFSRKQARLPDMINQGHVWYQADRDRLHFKTAHLLVFLKTSSLIKDVSPAQNREYLKEELNAVDSRIPISRGRTIRTWYIQLKKLHHKGRLLEVPVNPEELENVQPLNYKKENKF